MTSKKDSAIKSFFLGPQAENRDWVKQEIGRVFEHWFDWRRSLFPFDGSPISEDDKSSAWFKTARENFASSLDDLVKLYRMETPKFSPRYIGHMVSEISLPALFGHIVNLLHNPNLASKEVSIVGSTLEKEAIENLLQMVGVGPKTGTGHFTSGGTLANFEAIWRARYRLDHYLSLGTYLNLEKKSEYTAFQAAHLGERKYQELLSSVGGDETVHKKYSFVANGPWITAKHFQMAFGEEFFGPVILVPGNKHYSWQKGLSLMGFGDPSFWSIELDPEGRLCCEDLKQKIEKAKKDFRPILMVVSVAGTTELGEIDPVNKVQDLLDSYRKKENIHIWHHVDAAYGGFYCSLIEDTKKEPDLSPPALLALRALRRAESITLDPHKLGYVPYACGAILLSNETLNKVSSFSAPYLSKTADNTWSSTLEGSRSGSGASATWLTSKAMGFTPDGLGTILSKGILARKKLCKLLSEVQNLYVMQPSDTNIVCFCSALPGEALSKTNQRNLATYYRLKDGTKFAVSKTHLMFTDYTKLATSFSKQWNSKIDTEDLCLIRVVLMNPFIISTQTNVDYLKEFVKELTQS